MLIRKTTALLLVAIFASVSNADVFTAAYDFNGTGAPNVPSGVYVTAGNFITGAILNQSDIDANVAFMATSFTNGSNFHSFMVTPHAADVQMTFQSLTFDYQITNPFAFNNYSLQVFSSVDGFTTALAPGVVVGPSDGSLVNVSIDVESLGTVTGTPVEFRIVFDDDQNNVNARHTIDTLRLTLFSIPEPSSIALLSLAGLGLFIRRRRLV